ncbi:MAG: MipA/OmpV family protein [bacterium]|nr:MipA/OmpV family protein [bacterium]
MKKLPVLILISLPLVSCNMTEAPRVRADAVVMTQYAFRGVAMNERPILQGSMTTEFHVNELDRLDVTAWGNMSLTASAGDAVFQNTDILDVDENRWIVDYYHPLEAEDFKNFHAGVIQYSRQGFGTRELFAGTKVDWKQFTLEALAYWDIDEVDGVYGSGSILGTFNVDERTNGFWKATLGAASSNMANHLYGDNSAGLTDLLLEAGANRPLNKNTNMHAVAAFSTVLANDEALDAANIDSTRVWLGMGVNWAF